MSVRANRFREWAIAVKPEEKRKKRRKGKKKKIEWAFTKAFRETMVRWRRTAQVKRLCLSGLTFIEFSVDLLLRFVLVRIVYRFLQPTSRANSSGLGLRRPRDTNGKGQFQVERLRFSNSVCLSQSLHWFPRLSSSSSGSGSTTLSIWASLFINWSPHFFRLEQLRFDDFISLSKSLHYSLAAFLPPRVPQV